MIGLSYNLSKYMQIEVLENCWSGLFTSIHCTVILYRLDKEGKLLKFLRILITAVYFMGQN